MSKLIPVIDLNGEQIAEIDYTRLARDTLIHRHDNRLWVLTEGETLQEMETAPIDPNDLIGLDDHKA